MQVTKTQFKAEFEQLLDQLNQGNEDIIIIDNGEPIFKVSKCENSLNSSPEGCYQKLLNLKADIFDRRQGKSLTINPDELLFQLRNERDAEINASKIR